VNANKKIVLIADNSTLKLLYLSHICYFKQKYKFTQHSESQTQTYEILEDAAPLSLQVAKLYDSTNNLTTTG